MENHHMDECRIERRNDQVQASKKSINQAVNISPELEPTRGMMEVDIHLLPKKLLDAFGFWQDLSSLRRLGLGF